MPEGSTSPRTSIPAEASKPFQSSSSRRGFRYLRRVVEAMQDDALALDGDQNDPTVDHDLADLTEADGAELVLLVWSRGRALSRLSEGRRRRDKALKLENDDSAASGGGWMYWRDGSSSAIFFHPSQPVVIDLSSEAHFLASIAGDVFRVSFPGPTFRSEWGSMEGQAARANEPVTKSLRFEVEGWKVRGTTLTSTKCKGASVTLAPDGDFYHGNRPIIE